MIDKPLDEFAHRLCPSLVVQDPQEATCLPCRNQCAFRYVPENIVVGKVGNVGHVDSELVDESVQLSDDVSAAGDSETHQIIVDLCLERFVKIAHTRDASIAFSASLVGEDDTAESTSVEFVLVELAGSHRRAADGDVGSQYRVACHTIGSGAESTHTLAVKYVADHLAHLFVTTAQAVGHLHLRHVDVLCAIAKLLATHAVEDESRVGDVRWRNPESDVRTSRLLLVGRTSLDLLLPLHEFLQFCFIVHAEVAT